MTPYLPQMDFKSHLKASVYMVVPSLHKLENSFCSWDLINKTAPIKTLTSHSATCLHLSKSERTNIIIQPISAWQHDPNVEVTLASKSNPLKASLEMCFFHESKKLSNSENKKDNPHTCTQICTNNCQTSVTCSLPVPIRLYLCLCGRQELLSSRRSRCG